jgi:hypothetical protein
LIGDRMKIRKRSGIGGGAGRGRSPEGFEGSHWGDPRRDGGGEVFCEEGAEGLVLPGLNVAGGPVVEEADAKEMLTGSRDGDGGSQQTRLANVKRQFKFVVQCAGREEVRFVLRGRWS